MSDVGCVETSTALVLPREDFFLDTVGCGKLVSCASCLVDFAAAAVRREGFLLNDVCCS